MEPFCVKNSRLPEDEDKTFVLAHQVNIVDGGHPDNYLRYLVTTPRLLKLLSKANALHVDATYKVRLHKI